MLKNGVDAMSVREEHVASRSFVVNYPQEDAEHGIFRAVWKNEKQWMNTIEKALKKQYGRNFCLVTHWGNI